MAALGHVNFYFTFNLVLFYFCFDFILILFYFDFLLIFFVSILFLLLKKHRKIFLMAAMGHHRLGPNICRKIK